jgi:predicted HicB family RNase H-like nuclease
MKNPNYGFRIAWSDEDHAFVATCVELEGLSGLGDTPEQALSEANVAVELALEEYAAAGQSFPPERPLADHSGQFRLRLPKSLHAMLAMRAESEGVSLNALVQSCLAYSLGDIEARAFACKTMVATIAEIQNVYAFQALANLGSPRVANSRPSIDSPWFDTRVDAAGGTAWQH